MRKWIFGFGFILLAVLIWYLFMKPYDFSVSFKAKTLPEIVNQSVKVWNEKVEGSIEQNSDKSFDQKIKTNNSLLTYHWEVYLPNDSISKVTVFVKDENLSLLDKLKIPFLDTNYEKAAKKDLTEFLELLNDQLKNIRISILGVSSIDSTYCAYVPIKGKQFEKARGMMEYYGLLSTIFIDKDVELNGPPFIEITKWDRETDSIFYNFCYPIIKKDSLPSTFSKVQYKQFDARKAIKAIYNGNYMTSDRAWYALQHYAEKNSLEIIDLPIEVFKNNPNMGGNELDWETTVYLPLKE
jgi:effector-binding domain-containing protein